MLNRRSLLPALSALCLIGAVPALAPGATLTFETTVEFSGATAPLGPSPWMRAIFDDATGNPNSVQLTLDNFGLIDVESVGEWTFNFDPALDASLFTFIAIDESAIPGEVAEWQFENDGFMADGDGQFDIQGIFPPPQGAFNKRFSGGEILIYEFIYPTAIDAFSFDFESVMGAGQGTFGNAAMIQSIGPGLESGWVGGDSVPEPSLGLLLGVGVAGLVVLRRGGRKSQ